MKSLIALFCFAAVSAQAATLVLTNRMSFTIGTGRGVYEWKVSEDRMLASPEWIPEAQAIPLAPDKACQLGADWLKKNGFLQYGLETIEIRRYPSTYGDGPGAQLRKRYYYYLMYHSPPKARVKDYMLVFVLLDGVVLEPTHTPRTEKVK